MIVFPAARKWVAYSKLYQSLEVDSSVMFQQLTSIEYHWHQQELPYQQVHTLIARDGKYSVVGTFSVLVPFYC